MSEKIALHNTDFSAIPDDMKSVAQWVCWRFDAQKGKIPLNALTGGNAKVNDPATWTTFENAYQSAIANGLFTGENEHGIRGGIGFMFANGYCGVDLDHVIINGELHHKAIEIVNALDSYTEISPSGTGLHIFIKTSEALKSIGGKNRADLDKNFPGMHIEIYDERRYFTVTGEPYNNEVKPLNEQTDALKAVYFRYVDEAKTPPIEIFSEVNLQATKENTTPDTSALMPAQQSPRVNDNHVMTDADYRHLVKKISSSKQGEKFKSLFFSGNTAKYNSDDNRADSALCEILAWWTNDNFKQIDFVFRRSALMRPKWDEMRGSRTYGEITIDNAIKSNDEHQKAKQKNQAEHENQQEQNQEQGRSIFDKRDDFLQGRNLLFHGSIRGGTWYAYNSDKGFWVSMTDADIQADVANHFQHREKPRAISDIVTVCRYKVTEQIRPSFNTAPLINFSNGVLELNTGEFRKAKPDDLLTWQVGYEYNPVATCTNFDRFIFQVSQEEPSRMFFLDCIGGYIMFTDCRLEKCFFLLGEGGNGKSVYLKILDSVFASVNKQGYTQSVTHIQPKDFKDPTKVVMLENAIANIAYDINPDLRGTEEIFKSLISGEAITGNLKFHDTHSFIPRAKIICSCNSIPIFEDSSVGLARRPLFCDFNERFNPPDTNLLQKLMAERSGIFNRFYRAYRELIAREQRHEREIIPPSLDQEKRLDEFKAAANPVLEFWFAKMNELYNYTDNNKGDIPKQEVYSRYCKWCSETKLTPYPATVFHRKFQSTLRSQNIPFQSERNSGHRGESSYHLDAADLTAMF